MTSVVKPRSAKDDGPPASLVVIVVVVVKVIVVPVNATGAVVEPTCCGWSSQTGEMLTWPKLFVAHAPQIDRVEPSVGAVTVAPSALAFLTFPEQRPVSKDASPPLTS